MRKVWRQREEEERRRGGEVAMPAASCVYHDGWHLRAINLGDHCSEDEVDGISIHKGLVVAVACQPVAAALATDVAPVEESVVGVELHHTAAASTNVLPAGLEPVAITRRGTLSAAVESAAIIIPVCAAAVAIVGAESVQVVCVSTGSEQAVLSTRTAIVGEAALVGVAAHKVGGSISAPAVGNAVRPTKAEAQLRAWPKTVVLDGESQRQRGGTQVRGARGRIGCVSGGDMKDEDAHAEATT